MAAKSKTSQDPCPSGPPPPAPASFTSGGFVFFADFDSGNLGGVRQVGANNKDQQGGQTEQKDSDFKAPAAVTVGREEKSDDGASAAAAAASTAPIPAAIPAKSRPKKRSRRQRRVNTAPLHSLAPAPPPNDPTPTPSTPSDAEFELWTRPDCGGTPFENGNRTWYSSQTVESVVMYEKRLLFSFQVLLRY